MCKTFKIGTIIISLAIFTFFIWFLKDDIFSGLETLSLVSIFGNDGKYNMTGILPSLFSHVFGTYIPILFHINPHIYSMTVGAVIKSFNVVILCLTMSVFAFNGREKNKSFMTFLLFSMFYFCYAAANLDVKFTNIHSLPNYDIYGSFAILTEYSQHFGQLCSFIFELILLFFITKHFTQNKIPNSNFLIPLSIFFFLAGCSSLFVNITLATVIFAIDIYLLILNKNENKKNLFQKGRTIVIPSISFLAGLICFGFYPKFFNFFTLNFDFSSLLKNLFKTIIINNIFEFALIIILSSILYLLALKKSSFIKRTIFITFSAIVGIFIYFALFNKINTDIISSLTDSIILTRLLLMTLIYMLYGACQKEHTTEPKELKILSLMFFGILTFFMIVQIPLTINTLNLWRISCKETKVTTYCLEKIYRFYSLKGQTALLPEDSLLKIFQISPFIQDKELENNKNITDQTFFKHTPFTDLYYTKFYKNPKIVSYKFIN
jgi:hypothetical protein